MRSGDGQATALQPFRRGQRIKKPSAKAREVQADGTNIPGQVASSMLRILNRPNDPYSTDHPFDPAKRLDEAQPHQLASYPSAFESDEDRLLSLFKSDADLPSFSASSFMIYDWPRPAPTDFTNITELQRTWKENQDLLDTMFIEDECANDWCDFAGNADYWPSGNAHNEREYAIARTFVNRAKLAHRQCKSWEQFEKDEHSVDPAANIRQQRDPQRLRFLMGQTLSNQLRMAIFVRIKQRLRNEIWLEKTDGDIDCGIVSQCVDINQQADPQAFNGSLQDHLDEAIRQTIPDKCSVRQWLLFPDGYLRPVFR